jgi:hypothetical protein
MAEDNARAKERRIWVEERLRGALTRSNGKRHIQSQLEEELAPGQATDLVIPGLLNEAAVRLWVRRYHTEPGKDRNGVFDPSGHRSDLPLLGLVSERFYLI